MMRRLCALLCLAAAGLAIGALPALAGSPRHGIAMHGQPALPPGFTHLRYVRPDAPKGGRLTLGVLGTFDSLNPFTFKGISPPGLWGYVYESLLVRGEDEPFTLYGLIAESIEVPADRGEITFHLRPEARFSDGRPITADDVLFSHALLKEKGWPSLRSHYGKVAKAEKLGERSVRFTFSVSGDREIPLILGLMRVLPRHRTDSETFERTTLDTPVGSGPYLVDKVDAGRSITYRRNPDWWARDLPITRGRFNFAEVRYEYYRDGATLFEAFRSGEIDLRIEDDPGRWSEGYRFPAIEDGRIVRREIVTELPAGMWGLVFNTRRAVFGDPLVRQALILLFDAEWLGTSLYHGLYKRTQSYFERSYLSAHGRPASAAERALLAPYLTSVKPEVLEGAHTFPVSDGTGRNRDNREKAFRLLGEAGYALRGRQLVHARSGAPLAFELLTQTRTQERMLVGFAGALEPLGIRLRLRSVDSAQYAARTKSFDFDMIQASWGASLSPGNEQIGRWGSRAADLPNSLNYAGVKSAAADAMVDALLRATTEDAFVAAVRALDRVLISGDYVIPLYHLPRLWIAHVRRLRSPERGPLSGFDLDSWWSEESP
jgi:peptide/nickel transport system substrate-binding protein